jgi:TRAP-type C4-dicarboxylate transport system permease small subunit
MTDPMIRQHGPESQSQAVSESAAGAGSPPHGLWSRIEPWLVWIGAVGLLTATATDTIALIGRHIRVPLLGSIEIVQCAVLVAACISLLVATQRRSHARVHLVLDRLGPAMRARAERLHGIAGALFVVALLVGCAWVAADLWSAHEESELMRIPYRPLRVVLLLSLAGLVALFLRQSATGGRR